jgi:hypothetical protein
MPPHGNVNTNSAAVGRLKKAKEIAEKNYAVAPDKPPVAPVVQTQQFNPTLQRMATNIVSTHNHFIDLNEIYQGSSGEELSGEELWQQVYGTKPDEIILEDINEWRKLFVLTKKIFDAIMNENWCLITRDINPQDPNSRLNKIIERFETAPLAERREPKTLLSIQKMKGTKSSDGMTFFDLLVDNLNKAVASCRSCNKLYGVECNQECKWKQIQGFIGSCDEVVKSSLFSLAGVTGVKRNFGETGGRRTRRNKQKRSKKSKKSKLRKLGSRKKNNKRSNFAR